MIRGDIIDLRKCRHCGLHPETCACHAPRWNDQDIFELAGLTWTPDGWVKAGEQPRGRFYAARNNRKTAS
jgi:hypothetical protein